MKKPKLQDSKHSQHGSNWGETHYWEWNGFQCFWRLIGKENKTPIVLLHGFGASSSHWRNNASFLAKSGFKVYALDLVGFGKSEQPGPKILKKLDNSVWSDQVANFLEQVVQESTNKQKTILIGNSLGSLVALTTFVMKPEIVEAVIAAPLPDPAFMQQGFIPKKSFWQKVLKKLIILFFEILPLELLIPLISRTALIKIALQGAYFRSIKSDIELLRLVSIPAKRKTSAQALRAMCIGMALRSPEITAPSLLERLSRTKNRSKLTLIWGRYDKLVPLWLGKQLKEKYPWLTLSVIDKAGHCPHDECPNEFNSQILSWLELNSTNFQSKQ